MIRTMPPLILIVLFLSLSAFISCDTENSGFSLEDHGEINAESQADNYSPEPHVLGPALLSSHSGKIQDSSKEPDITEKIEDGNLLHAGLFSADDSASSSTGLSGNSGKDSKEINRGSFLPLEQDIRRLGLVELKEKRTGNSKIFIDEKGGNHGFFFSAPIHFMDKDGLWKDIDTTVIKLDQDYYYGVTENTYNVRFPLKADAALASADILFSGGRPVEYSITALRTDEGLWTAENSDVKTRAEGSAFYYEITSLGVSLRYTVSSALIKEDVIVAPDAAIRKMCRDGNLEIDFSLDSPGGISFAENYHDETVILDKRIPFFAGSSDEPLFILPVTATAGDIPVPVKGTLIDSGGSVSGRIIMKCSDLQAFEGETIVIDPSISEDISNSTYVSSNHDNELCMFTMGGYRRLFSGYHTRLLSYHYHWTHSYIFWENLFGAGSPMCPRVDINSATLYLYIERNHGGPSTYSFELRASSCPSVYYCDRRFAGDCLDWEPGSFNLNTIGSGESGWTGINVFNAVSVGSHSGNPHIDMRIFPMFTGTSRRYIETFNWHSNYPPYLHVDFSYTDTVCQDGDTQTRYVDCGNCGQQLQTRTCSNCVWRNWQDTGECINEGACAPDETECEPCGNMCGERIRVCGSSCQWGAWQECGSCVPEGICTPGDTETRTEPCGWCGEQEKERTCLANCTWGSWVDAGACMDQGECSAGETESDSCGDLCGTRTRTCTSSCQWDPWGPCLNEGVCNPGDTKPCGQRCEIELCLDTCEWGECGGGGPCIPGEEETDSCGDRCGEKTRTCNSSCHWDPWSDCVDGGPCSPGSEENEECGNCGERTRLCLPDCNWDGWGDCEGEGACEPGTSRDCGEHGTQLCTQECEWDSLCECIGYPLEEECGNCNLGTRTRSCDDGTLSEWGPCLDDGCSPGEKKNCGEHGVKTCKDNCEWDICECERPDDEGNDSYTGECGNGCGIRQRGCEDGSWGEWSECEALGECLPGESAECPNPEEGSMYCTDDCEWSYEDCGCTGESTGSCGDCGTRTRECVDGIWTEWSECMSLGDKDCPDGEICSTGGICVPAYDSENGAADVGGCSCSASSANPAGLNMFFLIGGFLLLLRSRFSFLLQ